MSTYRLYHAADSVNFEPFDLVGVFHREDDAHVAIEILTEKFGGVFEVIQSKRGRPVGAKDSKQRKRRTKVELIAKVMGIPEITTDNDNEPPPPSTVDAPVVEVSAIDNDEESPYNEPSPESFEQMMQDIEFDRADHNLHDEETGF